MQNNPRKSLFPSPPSSGRMHQVKRASDGRRITDRPPSSQHLSPVEPNQSSSGRKRSRSVEEDACHHSHECHKRIKGGSQRHSQHDSNLGGGVAEEQDPIHCWVSTGKWPNDFGAMSEPESEVPNKRRRSTPLSYSSRERDGSVPPAHTAAYEEELQRHGISFEDWKTKDAVTAVSKDMCRELLGLKGLAPAYNSCTEEIYMKLCHRASKCNEERVRRDLTPHIVPSAELLYILDGETTLENVREEMSVDWTKCSLLGGTQPRPDYAYGLSSATFTEEERCKMENYTNINHPTKFTESMYFPFLVCEAKSGKKNINDADRQNVHSASIAVNAIIELCRAGGEEHAQSLSGQILVFSISHDNERVKIYGHFPLFRDGRTTFHRDYIANYSLDDCHGRDRNTGSNFTRAVYCKFYPQHLKRIRYAIACLPDPRKTSMVSDISVGGDETQVSEQSSQERSSSRPPLHRAKSQGSQTQLTLMKEHMAKIEQMYMAQLEQQQKQMEQQQKQMEEQREDSRKQITLLQTLLSREQGS